MMDRAFWDDHYQDNPTHVMVRNPFLHETVSLMKPGTALDVGCGTGDNSFILAEKGWQVTGIDWSDTAILLADRQQPKEVSCSFHCADFERWQPPLPRQFDLVMLIFVLPTNKPDVAKMLQKAIQLTKANGDLLVMEWDKSMEAIWNEGVSNAHQLHDMLLSIDEIQDLMEGVEFRQAKVEKVPSKRLFPDAEDMRRLYQGAMNTILIQAHKVSC